MSLGQNIEFALYNNNISKTKFAKDIDISKSYLIRIINGEKPCSENMFQKIMNSPLISDSDKQKISDEYFTIQYGPDNFKKVKYLFHLLNNYNHTDETEYYLRTELFDNYFHDSNKPFIIGNHSEFIEIVHYFLAKSIGEKDFFFYTNYSFTQSELNNFLFSYFSKSGVTKNIHYDFVHLITLNELTEKEELSSMLCILKWLSLGMSTYYQCSSDNVPSGIFPYYIITKDAVITFSNDTSQGIVLTEPGIVQYYAKNFNQIKSTYTLCTKQYLDEIQFMFDLDTLKYKNKNIVLDGYICCGHLLTSELLNECAADTIPQDLKQQLIPTLIEHYALFKKHVTQYASMQSYRDFAQTGEYLAISNNYLKTFPVKWRVYIFERMITLLKDMLSENTSDAEDSPIKPSDFDQSGDISYIINDKRFVFPAHMSIAVIDKSVLLAGQYYEPNEDGSTFSYNYSVNMELPHMAYIFQLFFDYLERSGCVLNAETTIRFLEECISIAKRPEGLTNRLSFE